MAADGIFYVDPREHTDRELSEHRHSFSAFRHLVVFAALHVGMTLACLAFAFIGEDKLIALLLWLSGTLALIVVIAAHSAGAKEE